MEVDSIREKSRSFEYLHLSVKIVSAMIYEYKKQKNPNEPIRQFYNRTKGLNKCSNCEEV